MKKKGFTLVELLAVIVVLAIIAVIATPLILNVIDNAKKGAAEASASGYLDAIEKSILEEELKGNIKNKSKVYNVLELDFVNIKGDKPTEGWIRLNNGTVDDYELKIGNYIVKNENGQAKAEKGSYYLNGTVVYFNPETNEVCDDYTEENSKISVKTGCMKWYIFNDSEESKTVNMILDHNTSGDVAWNDGTKTGSTIDKAKTRLEEDTTTWDSSLNVRLITADEVAKITEADKYLNWNSTNDFGYTTVSSGFNDYYFDGNYGTDSTWKIQVVTGEGTSKYYWLFDNLYQANINGSYSENSQDDYKIGVCTAFGYWTSTAVNGAPGKAFTVGGEGVMSSYLAWGACASGIRPVIEISKDNILY